MRKIILSFLLVIVCFFQSKAQILLEVYDTVLEERVNPIGVDKINPKFSWKIRSESRNVLQTKYELRVSLDQKAISAGKKLLWSSGKIATDQSLHIPYGGKALESRKRYYWQVRIWDNHGNVSPWSEVQYWEMGLLHSGDWSAKWIEAEQITEGKVGPPPMFSRSFNIASQIKSARLYITSHGLYKATINGEPVTENVFNPGWTSYHKRLQYQTYDVTGLLKQGENTTLVTVGDGWYRGYLQWHGKRNFYGKEVGLLYQMEIDLVDGDRLSIDSDGTWRSSFDGPIRSSDIYNGEVVDSRMNCVGKVNWKSVRAIDYSLENLVAQEGLDVRRHEHFMPVDISQTSKGDWVVDFGQNLVGWVQLNVQGKIGENITISHAEVLDKHGDLYVKNLRSARQENTFILNGERQVLEPTFTFQGFRYAKISGYSGILTKKDLAAIAIYSAMTPTGSFSTSDSLVNQLQRNIQWGQKGNFLDIPTDCPQRDERIGWTADAQVFFYTAAYNMNVNLFFKKWLADLRADQYQNGNVPAVIPFTTKRATDGSAGWSDAATIIPWQHFTVYGDTSILEEQYDSMRAWLDFVSSESKDDLWMRTFHYGDWLFYTMNDDRDGKAAITDKSLIAQVFYAVSTQNLIHAARVLGRNEDVSTYSKLLDRIKKAFLREFVTPSGKLVSPTQTAYVLTLNFDLLPEEMRKQAAQRLVDNIKQYHYHLTTGFLGTPYLNNVLTRFGHIDVAYKLLLQETYPSWLYPVKMGATTIWERWDGIKPDGSFQTPSMNSFNHYAYGAVGNWMYSTVAGIKRKEDIASYKQIIIEPLPGGGLSFVKGELETPYGKIVSGWEIREGKVILNVTIPPNTTSMIILPNAQNKDIVSNTDTLLYECSESVSENKDRKLAIGSGSYWFEYEWNPESINMVRKVNDSK